MSTTESSNQQPVFQRHPVTNRLSVVWPNGKPEAVNLSPDDFAKLVIERDAAIGLAELDYDMLHTWRTRGESGRPDNNAWAVHYQRRTDLGLKPRRPPVKRDEHLS